MILSLGELLGEKTHTFENKSGMSRERVYFPHEQEIFVILFTDIFQIQIIVPVI